MANKTPMDIDQDHRSNALAFVGLGVLLVMNILAWRMQVWTPWPYQVIAIAGTIFFAFVNFTNTVETNSPWKSYGAFLFAMAVVVMYVHPISVHAINQP